MEDKSKCFEFGRDFARRVKEYNKKYTQGGIDAV
jgi:hypothetical protein